MDQSLHIKEERLNMLYTKVGKSLEDIAISKDTGRQNSNCTGNNMNYQQMKLYQIKKLLNIEEPME